MFDIKSKYKNPDKYIERLKKEVEWAWDSKKNTWNDYKKERGIHWFNYEDGVTKKVLLEAKDASESKIDQAVDLKGKIIGYEKIDNGRYRVIMEIKEVRLKED